MFTNFRAHDIHLTANPPFGVKSLQAFLEYAENLHYNQSVQYEDYDEAPFEDAICNFIAENGYEVDKKVGCAGFRVDLAIKDPENPGKYVLGIQCDGHNYASSKVARDRDRLREQVLNGLGWNIYHIWSTDWYRNRDLARAKLLENIESTIVNTKVKDLKKKINAVESMKINPINPIIPGDDEIENDEMNHKMDNESYDYHNEMDDKGIVDNDLANIQSIKEEISEKAEKNKEKEDLISQFMEGYDEELNKSSSKKDENISIDDLNLIDDEDIEFDEKIEDKLDNINKEKPVKESKIDTNKPKQERNIQTNKPEKVEKKNIQSNKPEKVEKKNIHTNKPKNQEKDKKSNSNIPKDNKFNSSKDNVSSKFEGNRKSKETKVKNKSSNKKEIVDGVFTVKDTVSSSENRENPSNRAKRNEHNRAKSFMNKIRNIGDGLVNNMQNNDSKDTKESQNSQKEEIKKSEVSQKKESIEKKPKEETIEKQIENKTQKVEQIDINKIDENPNLYKEKENNISDDNIVYTTEENIEYNPQEDLEENLEDDAENTTVFNLFDEDTEDATVFGLEEDDENITEYSQEKDIKEISEDIIKEINEEDLENIESEGIENMEYTAPRRKKKEEIYDETPGRWG